MCNKYGGKESTYTRWSIIDNNTFWGGGRRVEAERPSSCVLLIALLVALAKAFKYNRICIQVQLRAGTSDIRNSKVVTKHDDSLDR